MYLLATCTSRFEKHHLSSSTHFQSNLFHVQFLIHSGYQLLSDTQFSNTLSFLENFLFLMLVSFLAMQMMSSYSQMFVFVLCFWNVIKKCPPILVSWRISLYFLISGLAFPGADWMRGERDPLWLLYVWASGSHSTDYRRLSFPQYTLPAAWRKSSWLWTRGLPGRLSQWSVCLPYAVHATVIIVGLDCVKPSSVMPPALSFLFRTVLVTSLFLEMPF